jgi:aminocarboxymuconate-semialdehyde decarboxylase
MVRPEPKVNISETGPRQYFGMMYFDSLTHDPLSLEMLGRRMGWGHVLLGSDYPFDMASTDPVGGVEAVEMSDVDRARVLQSNAERFLRPMGEI